MITGSRYRNAPAYIMILWYALQYYQYLCWLYNWKTI